MINDLRSTIAQRDLCTHTVRLRFFIVVGTIVMVLAIPIAIAFLASDFQRKFAKLHPGMKLEDVEAVLGKGEKIPEESVPRVSRQAKDGQGAVLIRVVNGSHYYEWFDSEHGVEVIISFTDGLLTEKWCFKYDL